MRINLSSVMVDDQEKALKFYTEVLWFKKKTDMPIGEYRWLTVTSPDGPDGVELVLEPMGFRLPGYRKRVSEHQSQLSLG
jgi:predicted enzyme related to lactoylglutathione lyase